MRMRTLNISLPEDIIKRADAQAELEYMTRSEYIRHAIIQKLRLDEAATAPDIEEVVQNHRRKKLQASLHETLQDSNLDPYE